MKKLGKIRTLAIASLSALAIATPIALAQTAGTDQENKQVTAGEHRGRDKRGGDREGRGGWSGGEGRGGRMHGMMLEGVTLTDDQKAKMKNHKPELP
jgi:Spy/CpxP family protein refolding chaperone